MESSQCSFFNHIALIEVLRPCAYMTRYSEYLGSFHRKICCQKDFSTATQCHNRNNALSFELQTYVAIYLTKKRNYSFKLSQPLCNSKVLRLTGLTMGINIDACIHGVYFQLSLQEEDTEYLSWRPALASRSSAWVSTVALRASGWFSLSPGFTV